MHLREAEQRILCGDDDAPDALTSAELKSGAAYYTQVIASVHNDIGLLHTEQQDYGGAAAQFVRGDLPH